MLRKIDSFFTALNNKGVNYCHWKSNADLDRMLCGKSDIDLLVDKCDRTTIALIIGELGMVKAVAPLRKDMPGIEDYVGFDEDSGKLFHLHLHYVLIFGEKYVKNHVWNIEKYLLQTATIVDNVRVTDPNIELVMLFVRTFLKIDAVDIVKRWVGINKDYFPSHIVAEYKHLLLKCSDHKLKNAHELLIPYISFDEFSFYVHNIESLPLRTIVSVRRSTFRNFEMYERRGRLKRIFKKIYLATRKNRLTARWDRDVGKKYLADGGISVAILGPDGSGKSTQIKRLEEWASTNLRANVFYLGSGDGKKGALLSTLDFINSTLPKRKRTEVQSVDRERELSIFKLRDIFFIVRAMLIAKHRFENLKRSHKMKARGHIVLFDRFPQMETYGISDGPKIAESSNPIVSKLHSVEKTLYLKMLKFNPDKYIVLAIDPNECLRRKPDHDLEDISAKMELLNSRCERFPLSHIRIDAQQSVDAVTLSIAEEVWRLL